MRTGKLAMVCCALLLIGTFGVGCGDDEGGGGDTDGGAGSGAGTGAGTGAETDAGKDSGTPDASDDDDASTGRACENPLNELPSAILPRCTGETAVCVGQCESVVESEDRVACQDACIAADTTTGLLTCEDCRNYQVLACADANGCHEAIAGLRCCIADMCPEDSAPANCIETRCGGARDAALECIANNAPECADPTKAAIAKCFDRDDVDAGF